MDGSGSAHPVGPTDRRARVKPALVALFVAVVIVTAVYPEVALRGGSLSPVGLDPVVTRTTGQHVVQVYPNWKTRRPKDDIRDVGARLWQLVPATKFMERAIWHHESPFWNPYSAAGSYGPETLADIKFSPLVVMVALFGASSTAFTFVVLGFATLALFCLYGFFTRTLKTGAIAAIGACIVFILNGFAASDVNSQIGAPYVLFPVLLFTLAEYQRKGGIGRFLMAVLAFAGFVCTTFVPVQVLMLVVVFTVTLALDAPRVRAQAGLSSSQRIVAIVRRQVVVPVTAGLATAFVWLPDVVTLGHSGDDISSYGSRTLIAKGRIEEFKAITPWPIRGGTWTGYIGISVVFVIAAALPRARGRERRLLAVMAAFIVVALALHVGFPGVRSIASSFPVVRSVRADYWAALAGAAATIAVGLSLHVALQRGLSRSGAIAAAAFFTLCFAAIFATGVLTNRRSMSQLGILASVAFVALLTAVVAIGARDPARRRTFAVVVLCLVAFELLTYQNHVRLTRADVEDHVPSYVTFLRSHLGQGRILVAGSAGIYPEWGAVFRMPQVETILTTQLPEYRTFFEHYVNPAERRDLFLIIGQRPHVPFRARPAALNLLSVRFLVVDQRFAAYDAAVKRSYPLAFTDREAGIKVYANPFALPRTFLSGAVVRAKPHLAPELLSPATTHTNDDSLVRAARTAGIPAQAVGQDVGTAQIVTYENDHVRVDVDAKRSSVLVLTDSYQSHWSAAVDGKPVHLARVDDVMRGVVVPAGRSAVVFTYASPSRRVGGFVSMATIAMVLTGALALFVIRGRRAAAPMAC